MNNLSSSASLSFPQAISITESLIQQLADNQLKETEIEFAISSLIKTVQGARGFFVAYLTSELVVTDNPSSGVIQALQSSSEIVSDLLVKNLAMSTATMLVHRRNNDTIAVEGSQRVQRRTINIIQKLHSSTVNEKIQELKKTLIDETGSYQEFLDSQGYDSEQKRAIQEAISFLP